MQKGVITMKKFGKFIMTLAVIGGAAAGAYAVYKKYFAADDTDDFDEDFDDDFEDDTEDTEETAGREYVSLNPAPDTAKDGVSAEAVARKEAAMAEEETKKAQEAKENKE